MEEPKVSREVVPKTQEVPEGEREINYVNNRTGKKGKASQSDWARLKGQGLTQDLTPDWEPTEVEEKKK